MAKKPIHIRNKAHRGRSLANENVFNAAIFPPRILPITTVEVRIIIYAIRPLIIPLLRCYVGIDRICAPAVTRAGFVIKGNNFLEFSRFQGDFFETQKLELINWMHKEELCSHLRIEDKRELCHWHMDCRYIFLQFNVRICHDDHLHKGL